MRIPIQNTLALKRIVENFKGKDIDWALTGSTALAIHGVDVSVHDIDILTDVKNADRIAEALKEFMVEPMHLKDSLKFKSYYGLFKIHDVQIEVMADIKRIENDEWMEKGLPRLRTMKRFDGMNLPLLDIEEEYEAYKEMGRSEKANKIKEFIDKERKSHRTRAS